MRTNEKAKKTALKIFSVCSRVLLYAIVAILVFTASMLAYDKYIKKSAIPSFFGKSVLVIATPSMTGAVDAGDVIIIEKQSSYKVGDIITYLPAAEATSVTHRIVRIEGEKFYAKGDANNSEDPDPIFESQIVGKMVKRIPKVGIIIEWLRTWQGVAFVIAIGVVVVVLVMVADGYTNGEEDDSEDLNGLDVSITTEANSEK